MKELFESFRQWTEAEQDPRRGKTSDISIYRVTAILIVAKRIGRRKTDILSDIRAIEGITTVTVTGQRSNPQLDFSEVRIKIDTTPLPGLSAGQVVMKIKREIKKVKGVQSFKIASSPESL